MKNLTVITMAETQRVIMDGTRCTGVEYQKDGALRTAHASSEVILSAGVIGSAYSISGEAPSPEVYAAAMEGLKELPGGFMLAGSSVRAPEVSPFAWTVTRDGASATLTGFAPSLGAQARILAAAKAA